MNKKKDLTDEEIDEFDKLVDEWFEEIIDNFGIQMITNYIHMLGADHISYFLRKYCNLYRYNQQGQEGLNYKITQLLFHHSNKGCNNLYINAVGRMLLRDLMWRSSLGEKFFLDQ